MAKPDEEKENLRSISEKINLLLKVREKERILARLDGLYNLFITLSTFAVGIFISQRYFIATNVIISFPLLGVIFSMIGSFIIGFRGMIRNKMEYRILAYCLLISTPIWYLSMPILLIVSVIFPIETTQIQIIAITMTVLLSILTVSISKWFIKKFQRDFPSLFEEETINQGKIIGNTVMGVIIIFGLTFFVTIALFVWFLPSLLNPPTA